MDDLILSGDIKFQQNVIEAPKQKFKLSIEVDTAFNQIPMIKIDLLRITKTILRSMTRNDNELTTGTIADLKLVNKTVKFLKSNSLTVWFPVKFC